ncbi:MAG: hypothetical protein COA76_10770 [Moritella sp.]|nr:MAG: hypothetical protein COA76_10770 [Moritella sp.]
MPKIDIMEQTCLMIKIIKTRIVVLAIFTASPVSYLLVTIRSNRFVVIASLLFYNESIIIFKALFPYGKDIST